jgi:DNA-binding response OmpR family regulator
MHAPQILVVDDDLEIRKLLARYMQAQGFRVQLASECSEVRERIAASQIDLIVLDVMLPDGSGLDLCRDLRTTRSRIPIILLTALKEGVDQIIGLEIGADDCLGKPFNPRELVGRIRAILRRGQDDRSLQRKAERCLVEGIIADPSAPAVTDPEGGGVKLTRKAT